MIKMSDVEWSDWLDFNQETFEKIPKLSGVFTFGKSFNIFLSSVNSLSLENLSSLICLTASFYSM